jgi:hypothetical protein
MSLLRERQPVTMSLERFYRISTRLTILLACFLCLGCATPQVVPSGFLHDYNPLRLREDSTVYIADFPTTVSAITHVIFLRDIDSWMDDENVDEKFAEEMCQVLTTRLRMRMLQQVKGSSILVLEKESELAAYRNMPGVGILVVDCAITHLDKGVGISRYLIGFGLGDAQVTVEVKGTLTTNGVRESRQMVVFARSHGNPYTGLNPRSLSGRYTVRLALDSAAQKIVQMLGERMAPPKEKWWERKR